MTILGSYGTGVMLAAFGAHALVAVVLVALLIAALVGIVLYIVLPTRPYAGPVAVFVFILILVLGLL